MRRSHLALSIVGFLLSGTGCASHSAAPPVIRPEKLVDLSYSFGPDTIYWPTADGFKLQRVALGRTPGGYFYYANNISGAEHGGTHMDAPMHFADGKMTTERVPLANCIGPAVVIDVSVQAATNADYRLTPQDILAWEARHGRIADGAIVLLRSGWGRFWPDKKRYLGTDVPMDVENLRFPGFSKEAAELLVNQRSIAALAIDTASIDYGQSRDFIVHQVLHGADKPAFENVANADKLPPTGAMIIALPMKIEGGSGGPCRIIAILP